MLLIFQSTLPEGTSTKFSVVQFSAVIISIRAAQTDRDSAARYNTGEDWQKLVHKTKPAVIRLGADDFACKVFSGKVSEPVYICKVDLDKIDETLEKYEKEMVKLDHETAIIITIEGKVFSVVGETASVNFRALGNDALNGAIVTHNHPIKETRYSFSHYDITELLNYKLHTIRGVDEKYIYEIVTNQNTLFGDTTMVEHEFNDTFRKEYLEKIFKGEMEPDDEKEFHEINKIMAKKYKYVYRRVKR